MTRKIAAIDTDNKMPCRLDTVIEWLLIAMLAFMPLVFGVVAAWSEMVIVVLAGMMAVCFTLRLIIRADIPMVRTWAYLPIALFVLLVVLQLMPLPGSLVSTISPHTATVKATLLSDVADSDSVLSNMTLSFYPNATVNGLRLTLVIAMVFVIVINVYRRPEQIKRLLVAIMAIGGAIALLALAQDIFGNGKIYWFIPTFGTDYSGTFINHSNYGQFMNLSIGAAIGLLFVKLYEGFSKSDLLVSDVLSKLGHPSMREIWLCIAMVVIGAATIFISLTRGGMIALLIAGSFTAMMVALKRGLEGRSWVITVMTISAFVCVLYIGFDAVYDRLASLSEHDYTGHGSRWQIVKDITSAWLRFPLFGTGLGSHDVVYPMFDRSTISSLAGHAENEYAQMAEETGGIGFVMLLAMIVITWLSYAKVIRHSGRVNGLPIQAIGFGLGFGLLAIMIQSFSDFGQHLPANASLTAVCSGLLVAMAKMAKQSKLSRSGGSVAVAASGGRLAFAKAARVIIMIAVVGGFAWSVLGVNAARCGEYYWLKAMQAERLQDDSDWLSGNDEYTELLSNAQLATEYQPANVRYQYWLNVYRWRAISRVADPETGELIMTDETLDFTRRIVADLVEARKLCPTFGATYSLVGQLEYFILNDPTGIEHIHKGYQLAPCDATTCFVAGLLDVIQQECEPSIEKFRRAVELDGGMFADVIDVYISQANRPDLAVQLAGDDIGRLSTVARTLSEITDHAELADQARRDVIILLTEKCNQDDVSASSLASLAYVYMRQEDYPAAVEYFRSALAMDYGQTNWRLTMARALAQQSENEQAIHEARICLRLRPQMTAATRLIEELSVLPEQRQEN